MSTVLIVEDDEGARELLRMFVERGGYVAELAVNGSEALQKLRSGLLPCLIVLNVALNEFDGFSFREEQLKDAELGAIPVIVQSGVCDVKAAAAKLGAVAYFEKPSDLQSVLGVLRDDT